MLLDKKEFASVACNDYNQSSNACALKQTVMPVEQQHQQQQNNQQSQDQQMLREFFEENRFPMGCCSMDEVSGNIEQVISMALEDTKSQAVETCAKLQISKGKFSLILSR